MYKDEISKVSLNVNNCHLSYMYINLLIQLRNACSLVAHLCKPKTDWESPFPKENKRLYDPDIWNNEKTTPVPHVKGEWQDHSKCNVV